MATSKDPVENLTAFTTTVAVVTAWYAANIGVLLLNKAVLSSYDFRYPIFLTACHMACSTVLSYLISLMRIVPHQKIKSKRQLYKVATLAMVFSVSIVTGNASLRYIAVSFNQAIGSTTPAFTALLSFWILGKQESRTVYLSLIPVMVGIMIASGWEPGFNMLGFVLCITSTAVRALKTVLQALLLTDPTEKLSSLNLLYYMSPIALAVLAPLSLVLEDAPMRKAVALISQDVGFTYAFAANVLLAYFINLTNFLVTKYTSALTLQVLGNAKGVLAVAVSVLIFKNPISLTGMLGYAICVGGVFMYSEAKRRSVVSNTLKSARATLELLRDVEGGAEEKKLLLDTASSTGSLNKSASMRNVGR